MDGIEDSVPAPSDPSDDASAREAALREILQIISHSRDDEQPVFDAVVEYATRLCGATRCGLHILSDDGNSLKFVANFGGVFSDFVPGEFTFLADGPGSIPTSVRQKRVIRVSDLTETERYRSGNEIAVKLVEEEGFRTVLVVPLLAGDRALGAIALWRTEAKAFSENEESLARMFAAQATIAIENVRQFRDLQTRLMREAATREILHVISQSRDNEIPVFDTILEQAARLCRSPQAGLILANEERTSVTYAACWGAPSKHFQPGVSYWSIDSPIAITTSVREARVVNIADIVDDDLTRQGDADRLEIIEEEQIRSILAVPLLKDGVAIGCIDVYRHEVEPFLENEVKLLETFAAQAVIAIENVRQFKALESRTEEVQALNASLEERVEQQVGEIERMGRLKRFLPAAVADTVVSSGSDKMLSSHRALLGVLFCDIRGFTAFCETAEPEETIEVLQTYHQEMGRLINDHGAGVDHRMGDGIMVLFNDPLPCDDPAGEAVRLALAMRDRMEELCKSWKRLGHRLGFGVGVSLGYATVGMVGYEGRYDYTASGTAVNIAARLCDHAEDGEILLSPRAWTAIEDRIAVTSRGDVSFKGINREIEVMCIEPGAVLSA